MTLGRGWPPVLSLAEEGSLSLNQGSSSSVVSAASRAVAGSEEVVAWGLAAQSYLEVEAHGL